MPCTDMAMIEQSRSCSVSIYDIQARQKFAQRECLRMVFGGPAFHSTQPREAPEHFCVEPVLGLLRTEKGDKKFYLALQILRRRSQ